MSYREQFIWKRGIQLSVKPLRGKAEVKRQRAEGDWFGIRFYSPLTPSVAQDGACIHKGKRELEPSFCLLKYLKISSYRAGN